MAEKGGTDKKIKIQELMKLEEINEVRAYALYNAGYENINTLKNAKPEDLMKVNGINPTLAKKIIKTLNPKGQDIASFDVTITNFTGLKLFIPVFFLPYKLRGTLLLNDTKYILKYGNQFYSHIFWVSILVAISLGILFLVILPIAMISIPLILFMFGILFITNLFTKYLKEKDKDKITWSRQNEYEIEYDTNQIRYKGKFSTGYSIIMFGSLKIRINNNFNEFLNIIEK